MRKRVFAFLLAGIVAFAGIVADPAAVRAEELAPVAEELTEELAEEESEAVPEEAVLDAKTPRDGGNLELDKPTSVTAQASGLTYFSFTTDTQKAYYVLKVKKAEDSTGKSPNCILRAAPDPDSEELIEVSSLGDYMELGTFGGTNELNGKTIPALGAGKTYYIWVRTDGWDFNATFTVKKCLDLEGDTGALADTAVVGTETAGSFEDRYDKDVFEMKFEKQTYKLSAKTSGKILKLTFYKDASLTEAFDSFDIGTDFYEVKNKEIKNVPVDSTCYIVISFYGTLAQDPKGDPIDYRFTVKGSGSTSGEYAINYKLKGGENSPENPATYTKGTEIVLAAPTRLGYTFKGWFKDKDYTKRIKKIKTTDKGKKTLYAKWAKKKFKVTYVLDGGKNNKKNIKTFTITTKTFKLKKAKRSGYIFVGWFDEEGNQVTSIPKGSYESITLTAHWEAKE